MLIRLRQEEAGEEQATEAYQSSGSAISVPPACAPETAATYIPFRRVPCVFHIQTFAAKASTHSAQSHRAPLSSLSCSLSLLLFGPACVAFRCQPFRSPAATLCVSDNSFLELSCVVCSALSVSVPPPVFQFQFRFRQFLGFSASRLPSSQFIRDLKGGRTCCTQKNLNK